MQGFPVANCRKHSDAEHGVLPVASLPGRRSPDRRIPARRLEPAERRAHGDRIGEPEQPHQLHSVLGVVRRSGTPGESPGDRPASRPSPMLAPPPILHAVPPGVTGVADVTGVATRLPDGGWGGSAMHHTRTQLCSIEEGSRTRRRGYWQWGAQGPIKILTRVTNGPEPPRLDRSAPPRCANSPARSPIGGRS
jgi:hypothetical protein